MKPELKSKMFFLAAIVFIYVMLFEFILPINKILPKPSLLYETFLTVWTVYDLLYAFAITTTVIYVSLAIGYLVVSLKSRFIIYSFIELSQSVEPLKLFKYFPPFFVAILFVFWFNDSFWAEILFAVITAGFLLSKKLYAESKNIKKEYLEVARNSGLTPGEISKNIIWKAVQPNLFDELIRIHYLLWVLIMIYEFIADIRGLGGLYRTALLYNDYSAIIIFAILISLIIWLFDSLFTFIKNKILFWE